MPAETVRLPGGAKLNRKALFIAGAVGAGVVGYAYFTRRSEAIPEEVVTEEELDAVGDERIPTTGVPYDPSIPSGAAGITDNAMWTQFARDQLTNQGYEGVAVSEALGKFLDRKPLSSSEANIARAALAVAGEPPIGRPWTVIETQTPASVGMTAPILTATMPVWRNGAWEYTIAWAPVPGATRYWFQHVGGSSGYLTTTHTSTIRAAAGRADTWKFAGVNAANVKGPEATFTKVMPAAPASGGGGTTSKPGVPGFVSLTKTGRTTYNINFVVPRGATSYRYRRISGGTGSAWASGSAVLGTGKYAGTAHIKARAAFTRRTTFTVGLVAVNRYGSSAEVRSRNAITLP